MEYKNTHGLLPNFIRSSGISFESMILFCDITGMAAVDGYCYLTKNELSKLANVEITKIEESLQQLVNRGFIQLCTVLKDNQRVNAIIPNYMGVTHE